MSFNQPPPQPGYGSQPGYGGQPGYPQQPPQPGPPGPPQVQPAPGYGYPPQQAAAPAPAPGYGYPQQPAPYGTQPYGQQPPYGQTTWGAPPPPSGGGKGKVIGIVVGAVVALGLIGGGIAVFASGSGNGSGGGSYKLVMPATILSGAYPKNSAFDTGLSNGTTGNDQGMTSASADYGTSGADLYTISGTYGDVSDPDAAVTQMLASFTRIAAGNSGTPEKVSPAGFDGTVMKCAMLSKTLPFCAWGDDSTVVMVMYTDASADAITGGKAPKYATIQDFAKDVVKIRDAVRVKK